MIYTIGHRINYITAMSTNGPIKKLGKKDNHHGKPYSGGCVWETPEEAWIYILTERLSRYSVFSVDADWGKDTEKNDGDPYNSLLCDSTIVEEIPFESLVGVKFNIDTLGQTIDTE